MAFLDTAERTRDYILGNLSTAFDYGNQFNENFLEQRRIPEELSRTRLNDLNNRFSVSERLQNWKNDLETSGLESQYRNWEAGYRNREFPEVARLESLRRDADVLEAQYNVDNFDSVRKVEELELEQRRVEAETAIEKQSFDSMFNDLISLDPEYYSKTPVEQYDSLMNIANSRNEPPEVKARIRRKFIETARTDLENIRQLAASRSRLQSTFNLYAQLQAGGTDLSATQRRTLTDLQQEVIAYENSVGDIYGTVRIAQELGVLTPRQAGSILSGSGLTDTYSLQVNPVTPQQLQESNQPSNPEVTPVPPTQTDPSPVQQETLGQQTGLNIEQASELANVPVPTVQESQPTNVRPNELNEYVQPDEINTALNNGFVDVIIQSEPSISDELRTVLSQNSYTGPEAVNTLTAISQILDNMDTVLNINRLPLEELLTLKLQSIVELLQRNNVNIQ